VIIEEEKPHFFDILSSQNAAAGNQQSKHLPKTEYAFFERLNITMRDDQSYDDFMKCFYCYIEGVFNQFEFFELVG
jgi:histone deacetylase complex regulatory component SIN3